MIKAIFLFCLLGVGDLGGSNGTETEYVDKIEINTYCDYECFPIFTQMIFWKWVPFENRFRCVAWRMNKEIWKKSPEHRKVWEKHLSDYCDKHNLSFFHLKDKYLGEYLPIAGENFPVKKRDGYYHYVFYHNKKRILVKAKVISETSTQHDPERDDKDIDTLYRRDLGSYENEHDNALESYENCVF